MASIWAPEAFAVFSADGTADGYAVVTDNSPFYPSAEVFISNDNVQGQRAIITELSGTTKIGIRFVKEFPLTTPSYGRNSMAAYTAVLNSKIHMPGQVVRVDQPTFSKVKV